MVHLKFSLLVSCLEGALELPGNPLFTKLLLNTIDDGHDALDVTVEDIADLQTLECDLAVVLFGTFVRRHHGKATVGNVGNYW